MNELKDYDKRGINKLIHAVYRLAVIDYITYLRASAKGKPDVYKAELKDLENFFKHSFIAQALKIDFNTIHKKATKKIQMELENKKNKNKGNAKK